MKVILKKYSIIAVALLFFIVGCAFYWPIFRGYFLSDDFLHVGFLVDVSSNYNLLIKNFYSNWLDISVTGFYRPFISISLFFDHLIWGFNPSGFHFTNLMFHIGNSLFVFLIIYKLINTLKMPLSILGGLIFLLYPIHVEAVYWIIARVDTQATFFYLLSFYFYMIYRDNQKIVLLLSSILGACIGLGSKEIVVTLPIVIILYEIYKLSYEKSIRDKTFAKIVVTRTWIYAVLLGCYFILRKFALGTFFGGYNDQKVSLISSDLVEKWSYPLKKLVFPWNSDYFSDFYNVSVLRGIYLVGGILLLFLIALGLKKIVNRRNIFLIGLFVVSLAPVTPVIFVGHDLQGSRNLYLPGVFYITILISVVSDLSAVNFFSRLVNRKTINTALIGGLTLFCLVNTYVLNKNLEPWDYVSQRISKLPAEFNDVRDARSNENEPIVILGMTDNYYGAYFLRNGYTNFLAPPILNKRLDNISFYGSTSANGFGSQLKDFIVDESIPKKIYDYDLSNNKLIGFIPDQIDQMDFSRDIDFNGTELFDWSKSDDIIPQGTRDGVSTYNIIGNDPYIYTENLSLNTRNIESIDITMKISKSNTNIAQLYWTTEEENNFSEDKKVEFPITTDGLFHTYSISTREIENLGEKITGFRIDPSMDITDGKFLINSLTFKKIKLNENSLPSWSRLDHWGISARSGDLEMNDKLTNFKGNDLSLLSPRLVLDSGASNIISITMTVRQSNSEIGKIYWISEGDRKFDETKKVEFPIIADGLSHTYNIPVKNEISWWKNGSIIQFRVDPVVGSVDIEVENIEVETGSSLIPTLKFLHIQGNDGGYYKLNYAINFKRQSMSDKKIMLEFDATNVVGAKGTAFEISTQPFEYPNGYSFSNDSVYMYKYNSIHSSNYHLDLSKYLKKPGLYYIRMIATDNDGNPIGNFTNSSVVLFE